MISKMLKMESGRKTTQKLSQVFEKVVFCIIISQFEAIIFAKKSYILL